MFKNILVVCVGNICRSPSAEVMLREAVSGRGITVSSAGLGALVNHGVDATAQALLTEHGLDGSSHRARQIDRGILAASDLVLVMERKHVHRIIEIAPEASGKTFLLGKWQSDREIPDPYRQQRAAFEHVYTLMDEGVKSWVRYL
ncbi:low molecular weight phosphotyrosine protein phosphatase [Stenotrophomonas maltophilia]|uniref:protein-tyrosine-phosphatase n=2 Tax=Stenotrophomonas TaxID=40323 RepID=A0ABW1MXC9_9GAMM|nr:MULTISPECIES: low molecular weight protein-tyrosine-phosphatase [Stenotrophomonas]ALA88578.1 phosphotyrosine protein phosphatase [Stenotrophomonas maltophilia]HCL43829.1 low molecular weight phosphotyrosine protein phosphatase [Pseudomonas sp.]ALA92534.1 phosphotyrosine protein phosphatase [Stenotrophomonas maltophilia]KRG41467.1 phosphotyrosine protein phosphatase [Stenotrophomonas geniculata ATCC 19374 = JCM 13324]MBH1486132.1 low molecular weight phosphotyrosine protein phosphatase [Sten